MQHSSFPELQSIVPLSKSELRNNRATLRQQFIQKYEAKMASAAAFATTSPQENLDGDDGNDDNTSFINVYIAFRKLFIPFAVKAFRTIVIEHCLQGRTHVIVDIQTLFCTYRKSWLDDDNNTELVKLFNDNTTTFNKREVVVDDNVMGLLTAELVDEIAPLFPDTTIVQDVGAKLAEIRIEW